MVALSERLRVTAHLVTTGGVVADVGCDHAYSAIYLVQSGLAKRVVAMDVNPGPLTMAGDHVARYGEEGRIELRLSDGLQGLRVGEADTLLVGGMGGRLVMRILSEGKHAARQAKELVLQPQSEIASVRQFLHDNGYEIVDDVMIKEAGKYYVALRAVPSGDVRRYESPLFYRYGRIPLMNRDLTLLDYINHEYGKKKGIKTQLMVQNQNKGEMKTETKKRWEEVEEEISEIRSVKGDFYGLL